MEGSQPIYCSSSYSQRLRQKTIAASNKKKEKDLGINSVIQGCNLVSLSGKFVHTTPCTPKDCTHVKSQVYRSYRDRMDRVFGCNLCCKHSPA